MSDMDIILNKINAENKEVTKAFITNEILNRWDGFSQQEKYELAAAIFGHTQMLIRANLLEQRITSMNADDDERTTLVKSFNEKARLLNEAMVDFIDISAKCSRSVFK